MKKTIYSQFIILAGFITGLSLFVSCGSANAAEGNSKVETEENSNIQSINRKATEESKKYWYEGNAEISSYKLSQARYGEMRKGTAVLVYVTEPFSPSSNAKADRDRKDNVPVLKLNTTKKFTTGIYPYSLMNSSFFPFENESTSLKISSSMQEWCGMVYTEMANKGTLSFTHNSYFEGASFENKKVNKTILEDDLWSLIRLNPKQLPIGKQSVIPSLFFITLKHNELKSYKATITKSKVANGVVDYKLTYPELERTITIQYKSDFPHMIVGWEETYYSGYGANKKRMTSSATLIKTIKSAYWSKNQNRDSYLRKELGL